MRGRVPTFGFFCTFAIAVACGRSDLDETDEFGTSTGGSAAASGKSAAGGFAGSGGVVGSSGGFGGTISSGGSVGGGPSGAGGGGSPGVGGSGGATGGTGGVSATGGTGGVSATGGTGGASATGGAGGVGGTSGSGGGVGGVGGSGGGTSVACTQCMSQNCPQAAQCYANASCRSGLACALEQCGTGAGLGCFLNCYNGDHNTAFLGLQAIRCVVRQCGPECPNLGL